MWWGRGIYWESEREFYDISEGGNLEVGVREVALVNSRLAGGKGWEGVVVGRWDWWVLDRQNEEPCGVGRGGCGTGMGATRGKGGGPTR